MAKKQQDNQKGDIYGLFCPYNNELKYIGKANNYKERFKSHIRDSKTRNTPVYIWIKSLLNAGKLPIIKLLKESENWSFDEIELIKYHKEQGCNLLNVAKGGNEPYCTNEVRKLNGASVAKQIHSCNKKKRMWYLKKRVGENIKYLIDNGRIEKVDQILGKLKDNNIYIYV